MKIAWLYFNSTRERWLIAETEYELLSAQCYVLPDASDPSVGYESRWCNGRALYPVFCGKRLQRHRDVAH